MSKEATQKENEIEPDVFSGASFMNPAQIVDGLDFNLGNVVADFGSGTGYFAFPVAKKIGMEGKIWALDIRKEKLETIVSQAKLTGLTNIFVRHANLEKPKGSGLEDESCDWVVIANMMFQNVNKTSILDEAGRVLKPDGKVLLIDWNEENIPFGPAKRLRIPKEKMVRLATDSNFHVSGYIDVSAYHYGLILKK